MKGGGNVDRVRMTLRVVNELNDWLAQEAQRRGVSKNEIIITACWDMLKKREEREHGTSDCQRTDD